MRERDLPIDRKKHVMYSSSVKKLILKRLNTLYDKETSLAKWEKVQKQYVKFLEDLPYLGGKGCRHNGCGGTYDCIALFAFYEVERTSSFLDTLEAKKVLEEMNNSLFLPSFSRMGKILNCNSNFARKILHFAFNITSKGDKKVAYKTPDVNPNDEWPGGGYIMKVAPYKDERVYYRFNRCPIAEFAKKHNYLHIMSAFCNGDYPALDKVHASLIRNHTCANSDYCDFLIVGSNSEDAKKHPRKIDEKGYIYNDRIDDYPY